MLETVFSSIEYRLVNFVQSTRFSAELIALGMTELRLAADRELTWRPPVSLETCGSSCAYGIRIEILKEILKELP